MTQSVTLKWVLLWLMILLIIVRPGEGRGAGGGGVGRGGGGGGGYWVIPVVIGGFLVLACCAHACRDACQDEDENNETEEKAEELLPPSYQESKDFPATDLALFLGDRDEDIEKNAEEQCKRS